MSHSFAAASNRSLGWEQRGQSKPECELGPVTKVKLQSARQQSAFLMEKYESVYTESGGEALASALSLSRTDTAVGAAYVRANPTSTGAVMNQLRLAGVFCALTDDQVNALKVRSCTEISYMGSWGGGGGGVHVMLQLLHTLFPFQCRQNPSLPLTGPFWHSPFPLEYQRNWLAQLSLPLLPELRLSSSSPTSLQMLGSLKVSRLKDGLNDMSVFRNKDVQNSHTCCLCCVSFRLPVEAEEGPDLQHL